jgi:hypothetical protein
MHISIYLYIHRYIHIHMYTCERLIMALADVCDAEEDDRSSMPP